MQHDAIKSITRIMRTLAAVHLLLNSPLQAASNTTKKNPKIQKTLKKKKSKQPQPSTESTAMDTAEEAGTSKKQLLGNVGLSPSPLMGFGATLGLLNQQNKGLEAGFMMSSGKSDTVGISVTQLGGRYRLPVGTLFYGAAGAGLRVAKGSWYVLNQTADAQYQAGASLNAVTLDGGFGAQMKLGAILIGADLIGFSFPLFKLAVKNTKPAEEDYDTADADAQQGKFNKAAAGLTLNIAKVGIGIEF
jgi:hypothetical protein